ncbi:hypothetical protein COLO4_25198 [Corchorus olitorius]|uniref:Uncharacterized protein n=1 Tax=Corchorus olitorius TaxID=93759 RepID=A0A1R3I4I0_9ROSI|nr:hypothetical protein COLO4_25198 [Corchorus olitorius]
MALPFEKPQLLKKLQAEEQKTSKMDGFFL